jgi:branched-subunit amino acid ABC-type transport system permease component
MINTIAYGLTIGAILYIISIGLSLTFGTMRIVNFAHGLIYTIGAYLLVTFLPVARDNFILGAAMAVLAVIPVSYVVERFVIRKLYGISIDYAIIATYAVVLIGIDLIKWIWGASPIPLSDPVGIDVTLFGVTLPLYRLLIILFSFIIFGALTVFFKRTMVGISVDKYFAIIFVIGSCLAALGGVLYAPITSVHPYMGMMVLLISFAVVLVGGLGNIKGTFVAAFVLGLVMAITGRFWGPAAETMVFVVMGIMLIFKPIEV